MEHRVPDLNLAALAAGTRLRGEEAAAIVLAVGDALDWAAAPPPSDGIGLGPGGDIVLSASPEAQPPSPRAYAELLHDLLREPGAGDEGRVAGGLRLAVARGLGLIDLPPFADAKAFGSTIRRFVTRPASETILEVRARCADASAEGGSTPMAGEDLGAAPHWVERRVNAPRVDILRGMLLEADLQRHALLETAARTWPTAGAPAEQDADPDVVSDLPLYVMARENRGRLALVPREPGRNPAATTPKRLARHDRGTRATGVALAVALSFGGSYVLVRTFTSAGQEWTYSSSEDAPRNAAAGDGVVAAIETGAPPDAGEGQDAPPDEPPVASAGPIDGRAERAVTAASLPGRPQRLPLGQGRVFSPSFAPDGGSVYFHAEHTGGSRLMRADIGDGGGIRGVATLLDDGARNFHVRVSPDGRSVAFDSDREGERAVFVARHDASGIRRVSAPGYAAVPAWSPDGRTIAFLRAEPRKPRVWNLWAVDVDGGEERRLTGHASGQAWPGAWLGDGRRLAYTHEDRIYLLDTTTGERTWFETPRRGRLVRTAAVSPDGRHVAFQVYRDGMWMLDLRDGSMRRVLADPTAEEFAWTPTGTHVAFHSRRAGQWGLWMAPAP